MLGLMCWTAWQTISAHGKQAWKMAHGKTGLGNVGNRAWETGVGNGHNKRGMGKWAWGTGVGVECGARAGCGK